VRTYAIRRRRQLGEDGRSDADLLASARADEAAFGILVRRYVRTVTLLAAQILGDKDEAEDIAQDVFVVVFDRSSAFDATRPFPPWLFGIVRRLAMKRRARSARRRRLLRLWSGRSSETFDARQAEQALATRLDDARSEERARDALSQLSPMQRACFELVAVRAVQTGDVAAMHGISEATVRQHVFRARQALRKTIDALSPNSTQQEETER
jgi:RNA polymerase sigma-70 factor (ECF subfamily)